MAEFTIHSDKHATHSNLKRLFQFLSDFRNFRSVLPEDKVENFEYTEDQCSFSIKGVTPMNIKIKEKKEYSHIIFQTDGLAKFNFTLKANFIGESNQLGECKIELVGDLNPFIQSMVEKPLRALVNTMSLRLSKLELGPEL